MAVVAAGVVCRRVIDVPRTDQESELVLLGEQRRGETVIVDHVNMPGT